MEQCRQKNTVISLSDSSKKTQNFWRFARCDICDSAYAGIPDAAGRGRKRDRELENRNTRNSELDLRYSSTISKEDSIFLAV